MRQFFVCLITISVMLARVSQGATKVDIARQLLQDTSSHRSAYKQIQSIRQFYASQNSEFSNLYSHFFDLSDQFHIKVDKIESQINTDDLHANSRMDSYLSTLNVILNEMNDVALKLQSQSKLALSGLRGTFTKKNPSKPYLNQTFDTLVQYYISDLHQKIKQIELVYEKSLRQYRSSTQKSSLLVQQAVANTNNTNLKKVLEQLQITLVIKSHVEPLIWEMRSLDHLMDRQILAFLAFRAEQTLAEMNSLHEYFLDKIDQLVIPSSSLTAVREEMYGLKQRALEKLNLLLSRGSSRAVLVSKAKRRAQSLVRRYCEESQGRVMDCQLYELLRSFTKQDIKNLPESYLKQYEFAWDFLRGQASAES